MPRTYPTTSMCSGEILARFEPTCRDTDVFTTTVAKCGQTWLTALLWHLATRGDDPTFGGVGLGGRVPWLELPSPPGPGPDYDVDERLAYLDAMPSPRIFKMHVAFDEVPRPVGSTAKILTVTRDPRDVPYSMYRHLCAMSRGPFADGAPSFHDYVVDRWMQLALYPTYVAGYWAHRDAPGFLWLRYEDMVADLAGQARRIVDFLGWERTDDEIGKAVALCDFGHMQQTERASILPNSHFTKGQFFRSGKVGANRQELGPDLEARIMAWLGERLEPACLDFVCQPPPGS